ncbi:uncharacterized protein J3D65DRAFT_377480 [Phyllosticta citribraziliensis]|uniref:Zn(2)-C6 fungal-type domain-containing protein n=1 Tax=Phyllosticta citribraziliensis TaxID=989973 RepID=A0ABR1LS27_9PEZI
MPPIRSSQRTPLSCTACYSRKVKCSKEIPCRECTSRGIALECRRETVRVRGQLRSAGQPNRDLSYEALLQENARLATLLSRDGPSNFVDPPASATLVDMTEQYEKRLLGAVSRSQESRSVFQESHVLVPSRECSNTLLEHANVWTSWLHFAFFIPDFRHEHDQFWSRLSVHFSLSAEDPLWLAIYFGVLSSALLFMDDAEFVLCDPPLLNQEALLRNWYDSALFFLDKGDFMQKTNVRVVQAVTILGIVATNIGDTCRHSNLWACAVRMAQQLNLGSDHENLAQSAIDREARRRLWWTLVICEWLQVPCRTPCINDTDFDCALPADLDDDQLQAAHPASRRGPRPIQYHIAMSRIAIVLYQLRSKMRLRHWRAAEIAQFVFAADDQLGTIIGELPAHLQNDELETPATRERDRQFPWIPWQRKSLAMILLYYRIAINRVLQSHWLEGSTNYARARSICLSSAVAITHSASTNTENFSKLRPWGHAMLVFSATVTLALEVQGGNTLSSYSESIAQGKEFLAQVESQNEVAKQALRVLNDLIED